MSDECTPTDKTWPPPMSEPIAAKALAIARTQLGRAEDPGELGNQGEIVKWSCAWLLDPKDFDPLYASGGALWCAGLVGRCFLEAGIPISVLRRVWSLLCSTLWQRLQLPKSIALLDLPVLAWAQELPGRERPTPGTLYFARRGKARTIGHVGFVDVPGENGFSTIEGNHGNAVGARAHVAYNDKDLYGFIRIG